MYSFFELSGTKGARISAAAGALIITMVMMAAAIVPTSPVFALTMGVMA